MRWMHDLVQNSLSIEPRPGALFFTTINSALRFTNLAFHLVADTSRSWSPTKLRYQMQQTKRFGRS
jgi:hypothetical protein